MLGDIAVVASECEFDGICSVLAAPCVNGAADELPFAPFGIESLPARDVFEAFVPSLVPGRLLSEPFGCFEPTVGTLDKVNPFLNNPRPPLLPLFMLTPRDNGPFLPLSSLALGETTVGVA